MTGRRIDARHECEARPSRPCIRPIQQPTPAQRRDPGWGPIVLVLALVPILVVLAYALILAGHVSAQESRAIEGGARESEHGAPADGPPVQEGPALDRTRLLHAALHRAVAINGGRDAVAHCRSGGPARPGDGRWSRCDRRLRAFAALFVEAGEVHHVDAWLLAAQASRESGLNPWASGAAGEVGLMQLHPRGIGAPIAAQLARERDRCEARVDACQRPVIESAAAALRRAFERCGDETRALAAYNTGRCESDAGAAYARRVLRRREELQAWAAETAAEGEGPSSAAGRGLTEAGALIAGGGPS